METSTVQVEVVNTSIDELIKINQNTKVTEDILNEREKIKIAKLDSLRWVIGTEIPNENQSFGGETVYKSIFDEDDLFILKEKIIDLAKTL